MVNALSVTLHARPVKVPHLLVLHANLTWNSIHLSKPVSNSVSLRLKFLFQIELTQMLLESVKIAILNAPNVQVQLRLAQLVKTIICWILIWLVSAHVQVQMRRLLKEFANFVKSRVQHVQQQLTSVKAALQTTSFWVQINVYSIAQQSILWTMQTLHVCMRGLYVQMVSNLTILGLDAGPWHMLAIQGTKSTKMKVVVFLCQVLQFLSRSFWSQFSYASLFLAATWKISSTQKWSPIWFAL